MKTIKKLIKPIQANEIELNDIQAITLKGYGKKKVKCIFIKLSSNQKNVRKWMSSYAEQKITSMEWQIQAIQTTKNPTKRSIEIPKNKSLKQTTKKLITCLFLTNGGYKKLGFKEKSMPQDSSFIKGMSSMTVNSNLGDIPAGFWEPKYRKEIDAMVLFAYEDNDPIANEEKYLYNTLNNNKAGRILFFEEGKPLENKKEHFGYTDGISKLNLLDESYSPTGKDINQVLIHEGENRYGSYLVYRKLMQDVDLFEAKVDELEKSGIQRDFIYAQIMGRFKDGTPLSISGEPNTFPNENRFDYLNDQSGRICPFHAHIRKSHPRGDLKEEDPVLIARRSIPYGDKINGQELGLLFLSFQSSITDQFEKIQISWANNPDFKQDHVGIDPLNGRINEGSQKQIWSQEYEKEPTIPFDFWNVQNPILERTIIRLKGGYYFYAPSISSLKMLKFGRKKIAPIKQKKRYKMDFYKRRNI